MNTDYLSRTGTVSFAGLECAVTKELDSMDRTSVALLRHTTQVQF